MVSKKPVLFDLIPVLLQRHTYIMDQDMSHPSSGTAVNQGDPMGSGGALAGDE